MKSPNWDLAACSLSDCNMPLYHETLRCIASIHSYVVNEGKFDTSMDTFGKWCEYLQEENTCWGTLRNCSFKEIFFSLNLVLEDLIGVAVFNMLDSCLRDLCFRPGLRSFRVKPLNPETDQHLISPYSNMAESFIKIMRIKETIATKEAWLLNKFSFSVSEEVNA